MSLPALRQPKTHLTPPDKTRKSVNTQQFIILTLKSSMKLVITSDSFHCIVNVGDRYRCVLCNVIMENKFKLKEEHKISAEHCRLLKKYQYMEELAENLIRQIDNTNRFCTICCIMTPAHYVEHHVRTEVHASELSKAILRADIYKPCQSELGSSAELHNK